MSELNFSIRAATAADEASIKSMISHARLDSTNVHWENFLIAEANGEIIGIGQLKPYPDCTELGSLITLRPYRGKGVAAAIIAALEAKATFPLYLLCRDKLETFYNGFGYQRISWGEVPFYLRLKLTVAGLGRVFGIQAIAMKKPSA